MPHNRFEGSVVPFARRWHIIQEIDLVRLIAAHRRRAALCDRLEQLADGLPALPPPADMASLCQDILDAAIRDEGDELPFLDAMLRHGTDPLTDALLDHIRMRHWADVAMAQELVAALRPEAPDSRPAADALGYLLRGFFSGCRRGIDFEQLAIVALAGHRLTPEARAVLVDALAARAQG